MRILGIDPGSVATGFGVVERVDGDANSLAHVAHGVLRPRRGAPLAERLTWLYTEMSRVVCDYEPQAAVVERVFVAASAQSALVLGQARGAVLAALGSGEMTLHELSPREVKKAVVGTGNASKAQVQSMVAELLSLQADPESDAADALACAICHCGASRLQALGVRARRGRRSGRRRSPALSWKPAQ